MAVLLVKSTLSDVGSLFLERKLRRLVWKVMFARKVII